MISATETVLQLQQTILVLLLEQADLTFGRTHDREVWRVFSTTDVCCVAQGPEMGVTRCSP